MQSFNADNIISKFFLLVGRLLISLLTEWAGAHNVSYLHRFVADFWVASGAKYHSRWSCYHSALQLQQILNK